LILKTPAAPAGVFKAGLAIGESRFGVTTTPHDGGQLPARVLPVVSLVLGLCGVKIAALHLEGAAGVAELVDAEHQRVIGPCTSQGDLRPMVVHLVAEANEVVAPPAFGPLETIVYLLVEGELFHAALDLVVDFLSCCGSTKV
jgi:hypothetical protein